VTVGLSALTLNLRNVLDRYAERAPLLREGFGRLAPDIACLQEVAYLDEPQDAMLAAAAGHRSYRLFDARSGRFPDFGNAIMVGTGHVEATDELRLTNGRCAVRVLLLLPENLTMWVATTHLHHVPAEPDVRDEQVRAVLEWLDAAPGADAVVCTGDFNASPAEPAYARMVRGGFRSAYRDVHGGEPDVTWPSGIQAEGMDTDGDPACLDEIWLRGCVRARTAALAFDQPASTDPTLYPSDHFGVYAELSVGTAAARTASAR